MSRIDIVFRPLCAQIQFTKVTKLSQNVRKSGINIPVFLSKMVIIIRPIARILEGGLRECLISMQD